MGNEIPTRTDERTGTASTLGLIVPKRSPAPQNSLLLDPKKTAEWIASLPLANIGETSRQIYTTLLNFNRYEIPDKIRTKVVERFRPTVDYVCHSLRRHYMDVDFPLSQKAWKTVILTRELYDELATSYKILVERMLSGASERFDRKLLVIALHRTLCYLGRAYLQACLAYTRPPARLWKQVNAVYAFSRQNRIHRIPVKMKMEDSEEVSTIEERYKALLLFAATRPSRLRHSQLEITFHKTLEWSDQTKFLDRDDKLPVHGALNVRLTADEGPLHNALHMPVAGEHVSVLDMRPLIQRLRVEYEEALLDGSGKIHPGKPPLSRALLRQLIHSWHAPAAPRFVPTPWHFSPHVLSDFRSLHAALASSPPPDEERPIPLDSGPHINSPPLDDIPPLDPLAADDDSQLSLEPTSLELPPGDAQESHTSDPPMKATRSSEGAGGYCMPWPSTEQLPKVKVGQLLGVSSQDNPLKYSLAVIRWMRCISQEQLEVGMEVLSTHVRATYAYPLKPGKGRRKAKEKIPCLMLDCHHPPHGNAEPSLVFNSTALSPGSRFVLEGLPNDSQPIRLTRLIDIGNAFARFAFEQVINENDSEGQSSKPYNEFDSLWNAL